MHKIKSFSFCFFIALFLSAFAFIQSVVAASFDCHKADIITEKIICGSNELSSLDEELNKLYQQERKKEYVDEPKLIVQQRTWLTLRNQCEYSFDCIKALMQRRIAEFTPKIITPAYSWGGKLRAEPNLTSEQVGSTYEKQTIHIIAATSEKMNGYTWFKIEANGITAYQWGGILCAPGYSNSYCR